MSDSGENFMGFMLVVAVIVGLTLFGRWSADVSWENDLVDNPAGIAAIRSRVLAERAEKQAHQ